MLAMDPKSRAVNPTVICCFYLEDLNRSKKSACLPLWALSFFYETDLGISRPLGALHKVGRDERHGSQLLLHLLSTLEHPHCQHTHGTKLCLCLLHHQGQQKQTSGKLLLFCHFHWWDFNENGDFSCWDHWWPPLWHLVVIFLSSSCSAHLQHLP